MNLACIGKTKTRRFILLMAGIAFVLSYACNDSSTGSVNRPPNDPYSPFPGNGTQDVSITPLLNWQCEDPDSDLMLYDIYFGKSNPPNLLVQSWPNKHYQIDSPLGRDTTYYWRITAIDFNGARTEGPIWHFSTTHQSGLVFIGSCEAVGSVRNSFSIRDQLYIAAADSGVDIFDINNPAMPIRMGTYEYYNVMANDVLVDGNYAYVADYRNGFHIVDVGNPYTPHIVEFIYLPYQTHSLVKRYNDVFVACDTAGLKIINVEYPSYPFVKGSLSIGDAVAVDIDIYNNYAFLACGQRGLYIVNIADLTHPVLVSVYNTPGVVTAVKVAIINALTFVYIADGSEGYKLLDCTDPTDPALIYEYPLPGYAYDIAYDYHFVYVAAGTAGLMLLTDTGSVEVTDSYEADDPITNVSIDSDYIYVGHGFNTMTILQYLE